MARMNEALELALAVDGANAALFYASGKLDRKTAAKLKGMTIRAEGFFWQIHDPLNPEPSYRVRPIEDEGEGLLWDSDKVNDLDEDDDDSDENHNAGDEWKDKS